MTQTPPLFQDIGPMGPFFAAKDWASTGLGAPATWPQALKGYVDMILRMPEPAIIFWGPELIQIYNFGYSHIMGPRHPEFLGRTLKDCWPDTYDTVFPLMRETLAGKSVEVKDALIPVTRFGFTEETYFTFSFVPLRNNSGEIEGLIQPISEVTKELIARRRLVTVSELTPRVTRDTDPIATAQIAFRAAALDVPFAVIYSANDEGEPVLFRGAVGLEEDVPDFSALAVEVAATGRTVPIDNLGAYVTNREIGPWPEPVQRAVVVPLQRSTAVAPIGAVVFGISARLQYDETYQMFFESCARELASNLTLQREDRRRDELDRAKTAFFSNVSHEFRTPLTLMLGPIDDALADGSLNADQRERLELARRSGDRLFKLVNSLLDFSRIEAQRAHVQLETLDLAMLTADLASSFRSLVERAGMRLVVDVPLDPVPAAVDREMWEKIVLNLLSNAFKFTLEGEIRVEVRPRDSQVEVTVRDTGVGIPAAEQPKVFERFHRVEGTRGRSYEGSGIGLALVRELVALHGGTISVASTEGKGTSFTVTLPTGNAPIRATVRASDVAERSYVREAAGWIAEMTPSAVPVVSPADGPRILVADDNSDMREYVARLLAPSYRVTAVTNGVEALAEIERDRPDLVVSDVMMPILDGFGLLAKLRADPRTQTLPILLLSARAGEESRVDGLAAGADDYLPKPFSARELLARVAARLEIARVHAGMAAKLEQLVAARTAQLVEANHELESFSYSVSHDLRAPLRHILGFSQLLERRSAASLDDVSKRHLKTISDAASRGGELVDDLLAFSRMGRAELVRTSVSLDDLAASVKEELAPEQGSRSVTWQIDKLGQVSADPALLRLVVRNLMSNALKYTRPQAEAKITIGARSSPVGHEVFVRDNGVGFDMRYKDKLFGVFQRLHTAEEFEGNGIGLALVRRIVQRHGGRVWAEGALGEGATFHFALPAR